MRCLPWQLTIWPVPQWPLHMTPQKVKTPGHRQIQGQQACSHPSTPGAQLRFVPEVFPTNFDSRIYQAKIKNWKRLGFTSWDPPALNILQHKKKYEKIRAIKCNASLGNLQHDQSQKAPLQVKTPHHRQVQRQQACSHPSAPNAQLGSFPEMLLTNFGRRIYPTKIKNWIRIGIDLD